jgi:G:T-mismatch repair DNA endonuclease (very short patch repair protein)
MSEITTRAIAEGKIRRVSKLEDRVSDYLESRGILFDRQYGIRDPITGRYLASLDFFVDDRIAVEVNGTFWHADPRFYDLESLKPAQIRTLERWATKLDILTRLKIPLLVVWEHDLKEDFEGTLEMLIFDLTKT